MKQNAYFYVWRRMTLLLFVSIASMMSLMAREVTEDEAKTKALEFFNSQAVPAKRQARVSAAVGVSRVMPPQRAARVAAATATAPAYYIYNADDGCGFVVIAGESDVCEVLAYSLEGNFHPEYWDRGAGFFLDGYDEQIALVRSGELKAEAPAVTAVTPILLTTANWYQTGAYFNDNYAPKWGGESCISGCVATAMAEVMQYHQWPLAGRGSHSYTTETHSVSLTRNFANETFDWTMMPSSVSSGTPESDAVSRLMLDCGIAVEADYGTEDEETGAMMFHVAQALRDYFYYDNPRWVLRTWTESSDWIRSDWNNLILEELQQGRPVIVGATSSVSGGGHCFLADGVNASGVFHYNMGWRGYNNGYYTDGNITSSKYKMTEAVIGIKPLETASWRKVSPFTFSTVETYTSIEVGKAFTLYYDNLMNLGPDDFTGSLRVEMRDRNGVLKEVLCTREASDFSVGTYWSYIGFTCTIPNGVTIEEGDRLWLYTSSDNGITWLPVIVADENSSTLLLHNSIEEGIYYIRNVATGQYLSHGGAWGTHIAVDSRGIDLRLEQVDADNDTWRIYTGFDPFGSLGQNGYVDCTQSVEMKITEISNGIYTIQEQTIGRLLHVDRTRGLAFFSSTDLSNQLNQWEFISEEAMLAQRMASMSNATPEHPADATFLMPCPNMNNLHDQRMSAWVINTGGTSCSYGIFAEDSEPIMEVFRGSWNNCSEAFTVYQEATLIPGRYKLQVQGFYRDGDISNAANRYTARTEQISAYIFVGSDSVPLKSIFKEATSVSSKGFSTDSPLGYIPNTMTEAGYAMQQGLYENEMYFTVVEGRETVNIGVRGDVSRHYDNWTAFDNFRLTYYGLAGDAYDLTLGRSKHGTVSCFVDDEEVTSAKKGDVVTISVQPDNGYVVDKVTLYAYTATDATGVPVLRDGIEVTYDEMTGTWEFTMPEANVWIDVEYVAGTDGISTLKGVDSVNDGIWYNLNGQPVRKPSRGIYIRNGQKYVIR